MAQGSLSAVNDRWPMVARVSERLEMEWFRQCSPVSCVDEDEIAAGGIVTIAVTRVVLRTDPDKPFIVVSLHGRGM